MTALPHPQPWSYGLACPQLHIPVADYTGRRPYFALLGATTSSPPQNPYKLNHYLLAKVLECHFRTNAFRGPHYVWGGRALLGQFRSPLTG